MRKMDLCALTTMSTPIGNLRDLMAVVALTSSTLVAAAQTVVPDASNSPGIGCPISPVEFNGWFVAGSLTPNGLVNPPDNVNFSENGDCSFYQRAAHMFLWVTSPPLFGYGGDSYVFDSSVFYKVSHRGADKPPVLVAKSVERPKIATVSVPKRGPDGGVVVFDDAGKMYGVVQVERSRDIGSITIGADGMPAFLDKSGKPIKLAGDEIHTLRDSDGKTIVFKMPPATIKAHGQLFFLDQSGKAIAAGVGQADRDKHVLMMQDTTQYNKLVYYLTQVNDVYAYFLTGTKNEKIMPTPKTFPSSQEDLNAVKRYARGISFPDENALIVELKSSWIELPYARDYADYISITAQVPDFDTSDSTHKLWRQKGLRPATLAMVGMHIAFSVKDHPELIWATFEHVNNAPNVRYQYWDRGNFPGFGPWSFSSGGEGTANQARMVMDGDDIRAIDDKTIGPSDVLRVSPWGTYGAQFTPNRNTPVISTNNNVQGRLMHGDVRKNYMLVGTTWGNTAQLRQQGSLNLANSTIETFVQPASCLNCHDFTTNKLGGVITTLDGHRHGNGLSHIFGVLDPSFPVP